MICYHVSFSGAVTGKWEQAADSAAATITIGNQRYSGYFIAAENEKGTKVMSFTAVGSNNQSIWGAQNKKYTGSERASLSDYTNPEAELVMAPETVGEKSKSVKLSGTDLISGATYGGTRCADVYEISLDDGANICQWKYWGGDGQKFILEPAAMEKAPEKVIGDVNADGSFNVADLVMMQKFLLGAGELTDYAAGDLCEDEYIDVFDMIMMRKLIVSSK